VPTAFEVERLYCIADAASLGEVALGDAVDRMVGAGARWIQLRAPGRPDAEILQQARRAVRAAAEHGARVWMNDRPDLARLSGSFGVHLGQEDVPPAKAREWLGPEVLIGRSTHSRGQVLAAAEDPAVDVIAVGPVFTTASKPDAETPVGIELITWARDRTAKPLVAIGGIDADRAGRVLEAGADSVAVLGAVCRGGLEDNVRRLLKAVGES